MANTSELKQTELYEKTAARLCAASTMGIKISHVATETGISYHKLSSVAFAGRRTSYGYAAGLDESECAAVNSVLDSIKAAI